MGIELESLLTAWRAGEPVGDKLRHALAPLVQALPEMAWSLAFLTLADAVDDLRQNDVAAADVVKWVRRRIAYTPRQQKRDEWNLLGIPESTRRTREAKGLHVPKLRSVKGADKSAAPKYRSTADPEVERAELISYAHSDFEKMLGACFQFGFTDEETAVKLQTSVSRVKRVETILRNRAGY